MSGRTWFVAAALTVAVPCSAQMSATGSSSPDSVSPPPPIPIALAIPQTPPDFPRGRISGLVFGDLYGNLSGDPSHVYDANGADLGQTNIDGKKPITQGLNGVQIRRVYFQLDNDLSARIATRFRLEADSKSLTSDGKIGIALRSAYLQAKSVLPRTDLYFGLIVTPTWENSEEFWQYRAVEKMIGDFRSIGSATDLALEFKGFADPDHHVGYVAAIGDGNGQKPETDRFKKLYFALPLKVGALRVEPYADYQGVRVNLDRAQPVQPESAAVNNDQTTWKIFAGYEFRRVAIGFEAIDRLNRKGPAPTEEPRGYSYFARATVSSKVVVLARLDHWIPNRRADNRVDSQLWIAGVDWQPFKDVHVIPNIEAAQYLAKGTAVAPAHHDLQARITLFYRFSRPQS